MNDKLIVFSQNRSVDGGMLQALVRYFINSGGFACFIAVFVEHIHFIHNQIITKDWQIDLRLKSLTLAERKLTIDYLV